MTLVRGLCSSALVYARISAVTPLATVFALLVPFTYGVLVSAAVGEPTLAIVVGTGFAGVIGTVIPQAVGVVLLERHALTLEQLALSHTGITVALVGRLIAMVVHAALALPLAALAIGLLFGWVAVPEPLQVLACIAVGMAGFFAIGLLVVALLARRRYYAGTPNGLFPLLMLLGGVFVPMAAMPEWLEIPARLLAPAWAMEGIRSIEAGGSAWTEIAGGSVCALVATAAGVVYLKRLEHQMRVSPDTYLR